MKHKIIPIIIAAALMLPDAQAKEPAPFQEDTTNFWAIDMTLLTVDGKHYAVWSGWDRYYYMAEAPMQNMYIAPMTFHDEKPYVRLGKRALLTSPQLPFETRVNEHISLVEGPTALYHGDDIFILYSCRGSWTPDYKMGQLKLRKGCDPMLAESWEKKAEPVFCGVYESDGAGYLVGGVGHASFTLSPDGKENWIHFHSMASGGNGWGDRYSYLQKFTFDKDGNPYFGVPADPGKPMERPSGEVRIERKDGVKKPSRTFMNPVYRGADPWVIFHEGKYYICHTDVTSIMISESRFLSGFEDGKSFHEAARTVWTLSDDDSVWNSRQLWAPELHFMDGKWYIFYAAGQQRHGPFWSQRTGVLVSENGPFGPYVENDDKPLFTGD